MSIHPIFRYLFHQKAASLLVVAEIALCFAILCNAVHLIALRDQRINRELGVATDELIYIRAIDVDPNEASPGITAADLRALKEIPGVRSASTVNSIPFGGSSMNGGIRLSDDDERSVANAAIYAGSEGAVETLGLKLIKGRDFHANEWVDDKTLPGPLPSVIITQSLAERLFPGQDPLGKGFLLWGSSKHTVVGVVEHLIRPNDLQGDSAREYALLFPVRFPRAGLALRVDPDLREKILDRAVAVLGEQRSRRVFEQKEIFSEMVDRWYQRDRTMIWLLSAMTLIMVLVTSLGIIGLVSFWVQKRKKEIGIRRALGARRQHVLIQFMAENWILTAAGTALGAVLAVAINQYLMAYHEIARLPIAYLPIAGIAILVISSASVLWPTWRATKISPATATRSI